MDPLIEDTFLRNIEKEYERNIENTYGVKIC